MQVNAALGQHLRQRNCYFPGEPFGKIQADIVVYNLTPILHKQFLCAVKITICQRVIDGLQILKINYDILISVSSLIAVNQFRKLCVGKLLFRNMMASLRRFVSRSS